MTKWQDFGVQFGQNLKRVGFTLLTLIPCLFLFYVVVGIWYALDYQGSLEWVIFMPIYVLTFLIILRFFLIIPFLIIFHIINTANRTIVDMKLAHKSHKTRFFLKILISIVVFAILASLLALIIKDSIFEMRFE